MRYTTSVLWIQFMGLLVVVLGLVHCVLAPILTRGPLSLLMPEDARALLFMIIATGVATVFAGSLVLFAVGGLRRVEKWALSLCWRVSWFMLLLSGGAVAAMFTNPFAHLMFAFTVLLLIPLIHYRFSTLPKRHDVWPTGKPTVVKL